MKYQEEKEFVGNISQLFKVLKIRTMDGRSEGVKMLDVQNGSGMNFNINMDRGMDIPFLSYKGKNAGYISPVGIVSPVYFDDKGLGFLKGFTAGFLTTCGLNHTGAPCKYEGEAYGLHGRISNTPADYYSYEIKENDKGIPYMEFNGQALEGRIFQERLKLKRTIKSYYLQKRIEITDQVSNEGFRKERHMILYHFNIGYPFLSPDSEVIIPSVSVKARNEHSQTGIKEWDKIQKPTSGYEEMCYYHQLKKDENNMAAVAIYNHKLDLGISIKFDADTLDHFIQWKMMGQGDYVMGLEPANSTIDGIEDAIDNKSIKYLNSNEMVIYKLFVEIIEGKDELKLLKDSL